jgi:hypothetical protein
VVYRNKSLPLVKSAKLDIAQSYSHGAESGVAYFYSLADGRIDCAAPVAFATSKKVEFSAKALSDKDEAQTAVDDDFKANGLKALEGAAKVKVEAGKAKAAAPLKAPHAAKASKHHHHSSSHHKKKHH